MPNPAGHIASKVMGTMKSAKATLQGLSGVFRKLAEEHGEVTALFMRVAHSSDPATRRQLFGTIRKDLLAHEKAEMKAVYAVLMEHADTQQIAADHNREAMELEQMIEQLAALDVRDETWQSRVQNLAETVQRHAAEEEKDFFPRAQSILGEGVAEALLPRYEAAKREVTTHLN